MNTWLVLVAVLAALAAGLAAALRKTTPRSIAVWQIAGGVTILFAWIATLTQSTSVQVSALSFVSSLVIALLAIFAGLLLWRGSPKGARLSVIAQALQVAWVSLPAVQFGSTLGPTVGIRLTATTISFNMGFYGRGGLAIASDARFPLDITVNALAIVALLAVVPLAKTSVKPPAASPRLK